MKEQRNLLVWLIAGDILLVFTVTMVGFLDHYGAVEGWRWLSTFIPVLVGWLLIAPWLGVYQIQRTRDLRQLWRPLLAAILSAPMAAWLRGAWLNSAVLPLFVLVLSLTNALGVVIWRLLWAVIIRNYGYGTAKRIETHR